MDFHERSSQRKWLFTPQALLAHREQCNHTGFSKYLTSCGFSPEQAGTRTDTPYSAFQKMAVKSPPSLPPPMPTSKVSPPIRGLAGVSPVPPPHPAVGGEHTTTPTGPEGAASTTAEKIPDRLTVDEELALQNNFLTQIIRIATQTQVFGNLPPEVAATAAMFFKRYYHNISLMQKDPRVLLTTCFYLALKAEDIREFENIGNFIEKLRQINAKSFSDEKGFEESQFQQSELLLLTGLKFHLAVHHPFRCLRGSLEDWKDWHPKGISSQVLGDISERATLAINQLLFEDVFFIHRPAHIALACLRKVCRDRKEASLEEWMSARCTSTQREELKQTLDVIEERYMSRLTKTMDERIVAASCDKALTKKYQGFLKHFKGKGKGNKKRTAEKPGNLSSGKKPRPNSTNQM